MQFSTRSLQPVPKNHTVMPSTKFISWYCSEPRLAFNRTVVLRYRFFLEQKNLAPSTINVRLAAVRRLAYEASDSGLLSPDLAAGIRRVKGAASWRSDWQLVDRLISPGNCCENRSRTAFEANVIRRFWRSSLDVACDGPN
jgi:hypothetical protein